MKKKPKLYKFSKTNLSFLRYYCETMDRMSMTASDPDEADRYEAHAARVREVMDVVDKYALSPNYAELSGYRWKIATDATEWAKGQLFRNYVPKEQNRSRVSFPV